MKKVGNSNLYQIASKKVLKKIGVKIKFKSFILKQDHSK